MASVLIKNIYNSEISDNSAGGINYSGIAYIPSKFENVLFSNNGSILVQKVAAAHLIRLKRPPVF